MTTEQYNLIKQNEEMLSKAFHSASLTGVEAKLIRELSEVYVSLGNKKPNLRCGACVIGFLSTLYKELMAYEKQKEEVKKAKSKSNKNKS